MLSVRTAILHNDAPALLDAALLTAEAERVLFRPRSGINARELLVRTIRLAVERKDKTTLERLERVASARDDKEVLSQLSAAKLTAASRSATPGLNISIEDVDPQLVKFMHECLNGIAQARFIGDKSPLDQLESALTEMPQLGDPQKNFLKARIAEARNTLPATPNPDDPLSKLMASSRGWSIGPVKGDWPPKFLPANTTQFVGYSNVKKVYTADYKVTNKTSSPITIRVYSDSSTLNGKDWVVNAKSTRNFKSTLTTTWVVGGNSGPAPGYNDNRTHPWFTYRGQKAVLWDGDRWEHSGTTAFLLVR